jgi:hypothetical protein
VESATQSLGRPVDGRYPLQDLPVMAGGFERTRPICRARSGHKEAFRIASQAAVS